jgi:hypothetical protein
MLAVDPAGKTPLPIPQVSVGQNKEGGEMYTVSNQYRSGKQIKEDIKNGVVVRVFQPGPFGPDVRDGKGVIEGPHNPEPHRFYVQVEVKDGVAVKVVK